MKVIFSNISEIYRVFFKLRYPSDPEVRYAAQKVIQRLKINGESLGFSKKVNKVDLESKVLEILEEYNLDLSKEKLLFLQSYLKEKKEAELFKKKFYVQILISLIIVIPCLLLLFTNPNQDTQKAVYGFLGTVLGYWLR